MTIFDFVANYDTRKIISLSASARSIHVSELATKSEKGIFREYTLQGIFWYQKLLSNIFFKQSLNNLWLNKVLGVGADADKLIVLCML